MSRSSVGQREIHCTAVFLIKIAVTAICHVFFSSIFLALFQRQSQSERETERKREYADKERERERVPMLANAVVKRKSNLHRKSCCLNQAGQK